MTATLRAGIEYWQQRVGEEGACHEERRRFLRFCLHHGLQPTPDAVVLYLVHLYDERPRTAAALRYRLVQLDLAAALEGEPIPSQDPSLHRFMLGLRRALADAEEEHTCPPLYLADVHALLRAVDRDNGDQLRDAAFVALAFGSDIPLRELRHLMWHQVRFRRRQVEILVPLSKSGRGARGEVVIWERRSGACPVRALRAWSREAGRENAYVFTERNAAPMSPQRMRLLLGPLLTKRRQIGDALERPTTRALAKYVDFLRRPTLGQCRDRALITVAWAACLTSAEAIALRVEDVVVSGEGLVLQVAGRAGPVGVPPGLRPDYCPVEAWKQWRERRQAASPPSFAAPAFPIVRGAFIDVLPLGPKAPNRIVRERCEQAGLLDNYTFTSLRVGFLRTAARSNVPIDLLVRQSGLQRLSSAAVHARREQLISHSAAAMVGL